MRFAESIYLEDQDYWHLSGLFRSVRLVAKPKARIIDWKIDAEPNDRDRSGAVRADVQINRFDGFAGYRISLAVYDTQGRLLAQADAPVQRQAAYRAVEQPTACTARIRLAVPDIRPWTPETPDLYTAVLSLLAPSGAAIDHESSRIGFRRLEIENGIIRLNGRRLIIRGVNRHEHEARGGRTVSVAHMTAEIRLMKQLGINAVRTCHYPDNPAWYDLCDTWGLLVLCEANLETHGVMGELTHNPAWGQSFLERAIRMVLTHKNHPSIYGWSLGNESGVGANHAAMTGWIREYDPTRLCQYEAGHPASSISDVRGDMYAGQQRILDLLTDPADTRPVVLVEYLYQIRNSGGGMHHFAELVERYDRFQGGFIWDWQDKCLVARTGSGAEFYAYGGDFGESVTDWVNPVFMTCNGIVLPDLALKPVAHEVKQVYCPIIVSRADDADYRRPRPQPGRYVVRNRCLFLDSDAFAITYALRENGRIVQTGPVALPLIRAGEDAEILCAPDWLAQANALCHIEFTVRYAAATPFAPAGHELGCYQFALPGGSRAAAKPPAQTHPPLSLSEQAGLLRLSGADFSLSFDTRSGRLLDYVKGGTLCLSGGAVPCFTRPPSGLDAAPGWGCRDLWAVLDEPNTSFSLLGWSAGLGADGNAVLSASHAVGFAGSTEQVRVDTAYTVDGAGSVTVQATFTVSPDLVHLPRIGLAWTIPAGFEQLAYFGFGPVENYRDRRQCARLGVFTGTVEAEHFPFIPPSENGGHEETRWLTLAQSGGRQIRFASPVPFHFDVHHNSVEDYRRARHEHELVRRPESILHLDAQHCGIGGDMGWSTVLTQGDRVEARSCQMIVHVTAE
jgi:beta-galactosidase